MHYSIWLSKTSSLSLMILQSIVTAAAATAPIPSTFEAPHTSFLANETLEAAIDRRFTINPRYTTERIPPTSCLMNTVIFLSDISEFRWDSPVHLVRHANFPDYPNVEIDLETVTRSDLSAKFLVWALFLAIKDMTVHSSFFAVEFDVQWNRKVIAWLRFQRPKVQPGDEDGSMAIASTGSNNGSVLTKPADNPSDNVSTAGFHLDPRYRPEAKTLSIFDVFMVVIATLAQSARWDAMMRVQPFQTSDPDFNAELDILKAQGPVRKRPPFFERRWVTEAMTQIPKFMLEHGRFAELTFGVMVDGILVGNGTLLQKLGVAVS